jgi:hypothetical protein
VVKKAIAQAAVAVAMATAGVALPATSASAAEVQCASDFCLYDGTGYTGDYLEFIPSAVGTQCYNLTGSYHFDKKTSSIINNSGKGFMVFKGLDCPAANDAYIYPHSKANMSSAWNNNIRSFIWYDGS